MEHIPQPKSGRVARMREPMRVWTNVDYDGGPLLDYLDRIHWTEEDILKCSYSRRSQLEIHCVLQQWAYFGVLNQILGVPRPETSFTRREQNHLVLTTQALPQIVQSWIARQRQLPLAERRERERTMAGCLHHFSRIFTRIIIGNTQFLEPAFYLSVLILYEYLLAARLLAFGPWPTELGDYPISLDFFMTGGQELLITYMEDDGWCRSEISLLYENLNSMELFFVGNLDRPGPEKDHSNCSDQKCLAYQVKEEEYRTRHVVEGCRCNFVSTSQAELASILLDSTGSVPLVVPKEPEAWGDSELTVSLAESNIHGHFQRYVAISHVWSDGLGNSKANAIPLCQFRRISRLVSILYNGETVPFWLDTLCFPLEPEEAYNTALIRMRDSYENADKVLVLDGYLLSHNTEGLSYDEILAMIMCSPWNRRLWTLQEACLARNLVFQFATTHVDSSNAIKDSLEEKADLNSLLFPNIWNAHADLRAIEVADSKTMNILSAKKALSYRSTSVPGDEPLCLGNLLNVEPESVVEAKSTEARMKVIWDAQPEYFAPCLFWEGPKLPFKGYRWASLSLMDSYITSGKTYHGKSSPAILSPDGLLVQIPGILLSGPKFEPTSTFAFTTEENNYFLAVPHDASKLPKSHDQAVDPQARNASIPCRCAILMLDPLETKERSAAGLHVNALLVGIEDSHVVGESKANYLQVRILQKVSIASVEARIADAIEDTPTLKGLEVSDYVWCVD
jgi:hypothetical protein